MRSVDATDVKCDVASERKAVIESLMLLLFIAVPGAKVCVLIAILVSPRGGRTHIRIPDPTVPVEAMWGFVQNVSKAIARGFRFTFGLLAEVAGSLHERRVARRAERIAAYIAQGIEPGQWAWLKALSDLTQALILGTVLGVLASTILIIVVRQMVQSRFSGRHVANGDRQGPKRNGRGLDGVRPTLLLVITTLPPCTSRRPGYPGVAAGVWPGSAVPISMRSLGTDQSLGKFPPSSRLSRTHEKVAVVTLSAIIQAPSRKHIVNHCIWQYSAADRFMRICRAPEHNSMWTFNIR